MSKSNIPEDLVEKLNIASMYIAGAHQSKLYEEAIARDRIKLTLDHAKAIQDLIDEQTKALESVEIVIGAIKDYLGFNSDKTEELIKKWS